jgi:hypothetical protein
MRKIAVLVMTLVLLLGVWPAGAQSRDPAVRGADWLLEQQGEDGSFNEDFVVTAQALMAFAGVEMKNEAALAWLEEAAIQDEEIDLLEASVGLTAVVASEGEPETFAEGRLLESHTTLLRRARGENITELCYGLVASVNIGQSVPDMAIGFLGGLQNDDGGFSEGAGQESSVTTTAICTQVLVDAGEEGYVAETLTYFEETQNEDGGWSANLAEESDPIGTAMVIQALLAADEDLEEWGRPEFVLVGFQNRDTGAFELPDGDSTDNITATVLAVMPLRGVTLTGFAPEAEMVEEEMETSEDEGEVAGVPAISREWAVVASGFAMDELDSADDFLVTVVDPFTDEELYGVEIINWVAEYQYTGYLVEEHLPADVLLWLGENEASTWENISQTTLELLPTDILAQLPEDVQAQLGE